MTQILPSNSFWSMLPDMVGTGIDRYYQAQDRKNARTTEERNQLLQQLGLLEKQAQAGADVNAQISTIMEKLGMGKVTPATTAGQEREKILKTPDKSIEVKGFDMPGGAPIQGFTVKGKETISDDRYRKAGLPTNLDREREGVDRQVTAIKARAAKGEQITPYEASLAGIKTQQQVGMEGAQTASAFMGKTAPTYIKEWVLRNGGRIKATGADNNVDEMIGEAYGAFLERFGDKIPEQDRTNAKADFTAAAYDLLKDQENMDMEKAKLDLQRWIASNRSRGGGSTTSPEDSGKLVDMLTRMGNGVENDIATTFGTQQKVFMQALLQGMKPEQMGANRVGYESFVQQVSKLNKIRAASAAAARGLSSDPTVLSILDELSNGSSSAAPADGSAPRPKRLTRDGREIITADQKAYLQANGKWDASKYVVE